MKASTLARCFDDALQMSSDLSGVVREALAHFPVQAADMKATDFVKCLWTTAWLKDSLPDILKMVPAIVRTFSKQGLGDDCGEISAIACGPCQC